MQLDLQTKNLLLISGWTDAEQHTRWLNNKELMKYSEQRHRIHTVESQKKYLSGFDFQTSFIWEISPPKFPPLGTITAYIDLYNEVADVGILIAAFQQHGYGTEAWQAVCDWLLLKERLVRKVEAGCMMSNYGMRRICEKTMMFAEGVRSGHFLLDGKPEDLLLYGRRV